MPAEPRASLGGRGGAPCSQSRACRICEGEHTHAHMHISTHIRLHVVGKETVDAASADTSSPI